MMEYTAETQPETKLEYILENQRLREINARLLAGLTHIADYMDDSNPSYCPQPEVVRSIANQTLEEATS